VQCQQEERKGLTLGKAQPSAHVKSGVLANRSFGLTLPAGPATCRLVLYCFMPQKTAVLFTPYGCTVIALEAEGVRQVAHVGMLPGERRREQPTRISSACHPLCHRCSITEPVNSKQHLAFFFPFLFLAAFCFQVSSLWHHLNSGGHLPRESLPPTQDSSLCSSSTAGG